MNARANHGIGKSVPLCSRHIAAAALLLQDTQLREPRADGGLRAAVKVLLASRDHMSTERTATINALTALLRVLDLGIDAHHHADRHDRRVENTQQRPRHPNRTR